MMTVIANQAALALRLSATQRRMRELDVVADRDRIARDLHDHVIQCLFALGLGLQGTLRRAYRCPGRACRKPLHGEPQTGRRHHPALECDLP